MTNSEENEVKKLRSELKALQEMFRQLTEEEKNESYDLRRSKMLKAQVIQLERQCMLLSDALSSRASVMIETENELISLIELLRSTLAQDTPGSAVTISRKELISHIQALQKLIVSIQKQSILSGSENLRISQLSGLKLCKADNVSCLDACSGKTEHLNLQHVAFLEDKLVALMRRLTSYQTLLQSTFIKSRFSEEERIRSNQENKTLETDFAEKYLFSVGFRKILVDTDACIESIEDCAQNLLALSMLHPSAPWSVTKTPQKFGLFEVNSILRSFPTNLQRHKEVKLIIAALCKAHSYVTHVNELKLNAVKSEVKFCSQINATYAHYMTCLLDGVKEAYSDCERNLSKLISEPIADILNSWIALKSSQTETTMRELMSCLKRNESRLNRLIEKMSTSVLDKTADTNHSETGLKVLEAFGAELTERIELLKRQCAKTKSLHHVELEDYMHRNEVVVVERLKSMLHNT